jgi:hypothetical protein
VRFGALTRHAEIEASPAPAVSFMPCAAGMGRIDFKYRGSELICEASGPEFRTAMIHTWAGGIAIDEPRTTKIGSLNREIKDRVIKERDHPTGIAGGGNLRPRLAIARSPRIATIRD